MLLIREYSLNPGSWNLWTYSRISILTLYQLLVFGVSKLCACTYIYPSRAGRHTRNDERVIRKMNLLEVDSRLIESQLFVCVETAVW